MLREKTITFAGNFITVNDKIIDMNMFKKFIVKENETKTEENKYTEFSFTFDRRYLKIRISDGKSLPYNPIVYNNETQQKEDNPRNTSQIEPKESFAIIDFSTCLLWVSNVYKKNAIVNYLKESIPDSRIIVKDVYNQDDFLKCLQNLDEIRLSVRPDLLSKTNTLTNAMKDEVYQYDAVSATLSLKYKNKFVGNSLHDKIRTLFDDRLSYKDIMISGRDEKGAGLLFNSDTFSKKIEFRAKIDENEMYDHEDVFTKLIQELENEKSN